MPLDSKTVIAVTNTNVVGLRLVPTAKVARCTVAGWTVESQVRSNNYNKALCTRFTDPCGRVVQIILPGYHMDNARDALGARLTPEIGALLKQNLTPQAIADAVAALNKVFTAAWELDPAVTGHEALIAIQEATLNSEPGSVGSFLAAVESYLHPLRITAAATDIYPVRTVAAMLDVGWTPLIVAAWVNLDFQHPSSTSITPAWVRAVHETGINPSEFVMWARHGTFTLFNQTASEVALLGAYQQAGFSVPMLLALSRTQMPNPPSRVRIVKGWERYPFSDALRLHNAGITPREARAFVRNGVLTEDNVAFLTAMRTTPTPSP